MKMPRYSASMPSPRVSVYRNEGVGFEGVGFLWGGKLCLWGDFLMHANFHP